MLHYQPRSESCRGARLGLVVGKKLLKNAVDRNRVKRVIREQFRRICRDLPAYDLVVRLAVKPVSLDGKLVAADFLALLDKLPRLRPARVIQ